MDLLFFFKGVIIGIAIAAPVGPIGILCIRKTLESGRWSGFFSGLGAAIADTLYGVVAAFGLTLVSNFLLAGQFWLRVIGGAFLIYLGIKTFLAKPIEKTEKGATDNTLLRDLLSTFFLTLTNPMTIVAYLGVFAGLGLSYKPGDYATATSLVLGVFIGSALWWLILSEGVTFFRKQVNQNVMSWINRVAGVIITAFGIVVWISL